MIDIVAIVVIFAICFILILFCGHKYLNYKVSTRTASSYKRSLFVKDMLIISILALMVACIATTSLIGFIYYEQTERVSNYTYSGVNN
jgi:hypothetical protein